MNTKSMGIMVSLEAKNNWITRLRAWFINKMLNPWYGVAITPIRKKNIPVKLHIDGLEIEAHIDPEEWKNVICSMGE